MRSGRSWSRCCRPGLPWPAAGAPAPGGHRGDRVRDPDRVRLAVPASGLPALVDRLRVLRRLARRWHRGPAARRLTRARSRRGRARSPAHPGGDRLPVGARRRHRAQGQPRLGQRQEGQRTQAAHRRRCHRAAARRGGHPGQRPGPRRRPAAAMEPAPDLPARPAGLGRCRVHPQAHQLGPRRSANHRAGRLQARPARLRSPAPALGGRADLRLDQHLPPLCTRLRTPASQPRSNGLVGHDRPHDPAARPLSPHFGNRLIKHSLRSRPAGG